jgi:hypothetical protein
MNTKLLTDGDEVEMLSMLRALKQVVAEAGPDYVYQRKVVDGFNANQPACVYVFQGEPDCLAGRVLARMGVSTETLAIWEGKRCTQMSPVISTPPGLGVLPIHLSYPTLNVLSVAQDAQDAGKTWANALGTAREFASIHYGVKV